METAVEGAHRSHSKYAHFTPKMCHFTGKSLKNLKWNLMYLDQCAAKIGGGKQTAAFSLQHHLYLPSHLSPGFMSTDAL